MVLLSKYKYWLTKTKPIWVDQDRDDSVIIRSQVLSPEGTEYKNSYEISCCVLHKDTEAQSLDKTDIIERDVFWKEIFFLKDT